MLYSFSFFRFFFLERASVLSLVQCLFTDLRQLLLYGFVCLLD